jgi:hypothetical protein
MGQAMGSCEGRSARKLERHGDAWKARREEGRFGGPPLALPRSGAGTLRRPGVSLTARPVGTIAVSVPALIAALAVGASTAQAADVTVGCDQQGGQVTVPMGSTITACDRFFRHYG